MEKNESLKVAYTEGFVSIVVNTALFAVKFWAGIVTNSAAIMADAWHTMSDSLTSIVVVVAAKFAGKKKDAEHPFGHGRYEQIASLVIAFVLAIVAYDFLLESYSRFSHHVAATYGPIAIIVTIISIVVKEALAQYAFILGKRTGNSSVKADAWHHRSDALSSVVVLAGILFASKFWWIDSVLGALIALMLFYATYKIAREAVEKLLGEAPSQELIDGIGEIAKNVYSKNCRLHHFHIHNYVTHSELTFHIKLDGDLSIREGHLIATKIENQIAEKYGITATAHMEPLDFQHASD